jgi:pSer/pThr/pTyr-binding forkhead associated (FHA) protein
MFALDRAKMNPETRTVKIGRGQSCDLILSHPSISRTHAELTWNPNGAVEIRDLNSMGGTFVLRNGQERSVSTERLEPADILRIGDYEISLADLLARMGVPLPQPQSTAQSTSAAKPNVPATDSGNAPKTRMVRCECGTIKKRGEKCPACGA